MVHISGGNPLGGSISTGEIADGAVTNAKVNTSAAIAFSKLAALTSGNLIVGSAANVPTSVATSGDVTIVASGATTIGTDKVLGTMIKIGAEAAGDMFYSDGTDVVRLAKGTANQRLSMNAGATAPEWQTVAAGGGNFTLVSTQTLGGAGTTLTWSSLDINTDGYYVLIYNLDSAGAGDSRIDLYVENDTTAANYYSQSFEADGATLTGARANNAKVGYIDNNESASGRIIIWRNKGGFYNCSALSSRHQELASAMFSHTYWVAKTATSTNITRLDLVGSTNLATGSTASLYKVTKS